MSNVDIPTELYNNNKIALLESYKGAMKHHRMQCLVCQHIWTATPTSKRQTLKKYGVSGCPNCKQQRTEQDYEQKRQDNINKLYERGIIIVDSSYDGRRHFEQHTKVKVKNINCGHQFESSPANLLANNVECPICADEKRKQCLNQSSKYRSKIWQQTADQWELYKSKVTSLTKKNYNKHKKQINPKNLPRGKAGQPNAYHLDHIVPIRFCFENNIPPEVCADPTNLQMLHWNDNVGSRNHIKGTIPPLFLKYINSGTRLQQYAQLIKQQAFSDAEMFVKVGDIVATVYDQASNYVVVIMPTDQTYANLKTANNTVNTLLSEQINHSVIFEDELNNNFSLIINKLKHYANRNQCTRIHARDCTIEEISSQQKSSFLNRNHIQGNDTGQINYGAFYKQHLVAVMTFCKPRVVLGYKQNNTSPNMWELSRFATDITVRIPGIAGKMLKHFEKNNQWSKIISYADRRWSNGDLYQKLGFEVEQINKPDYFYIVDGQRKHRWNYRKDVLKDFLSTYNQDLTEYQNMTNAGYWRLWDAGTIRYSKISD